MKLLLASLILALAACQNGGDKDNSSGDADAKAAKEEQDKVNNLSSAREKLTELEFLLGELDSATTAEQIDNAREDLDGFVKNTKTIDLSGVSGVSASLVDGNGAGKSLGKFIKDGVLNLKDLYDSLFKPDGGFADDFGDIVEDILTGIGEIITTIVNAIGPIWGGMWGCDFCRGDDLTGPDKVDNTCELMTLPVPPSGNDIWKCLLQKCNAAGGRLVSKNCTEGSDHRNCKGFKGKSLPCQPDPPGEVDIIAFWCEKPGSGKPVFPPPGIGKDVCRKAPAGGASPDKSDEPAAPGDGDDDDGGEGETTGDTSSSTGGTSTTTGGGGSSTGTEEIQ